jgi:hypothetical protein
LVNDVSLVVRPLVEQLERAQAADEESVTFFANINASQVPNQEGATSLFLSKDRQGLVLRTNIRYIETNESLLDWVAIVPVGVDPSKPLQGGAHGNPQVKSHGRDNETTKVTLNKKTGAMVGGKRKIFGLFKAVIRNLMNSHILSFM